MTLLYIAFGVALVTVAIVGCLWAGWATAEAANRPELAGSVFARYLLVVGTLVVLAAYGWVDRGSVFVGVLAAVLGRRCAESVVDRPRKAVKR